MGGCGEGLALMEGVKGDPAANWEDGLGEGTAEGKAEAEEKGGGFKLEGEGEGTLPIRPKVEQGRGDGFVTEEG